MPGLSRNVHFHVVSCIPDSLIGVLHGINTRNFTLCRAASVSFIRFSAAFSALRLSVAPDNSALPALLHPANPSAFFLLKIVKTLLIVFNLRRCAVQGSLFARDTFSCKAAICYPASLHDQYSWPHPRNDSTNRQILQRTAKRIEVIINIRSTRSVSSASADMAIRAASLDRPDPQGHVSAQAEWQ